MFAALSSIQGIRRARGNSTASVNNSTASSSSVSGGAAISTIGDATVELMYPESVGSGRSPGTASTFPDTETPSIYPFASLSSQSSHSSGASASSSRRLSNNLFGSSRFRDASYMKGGQRNRNLSTTNSSTSVNTSHTGPAIAITTAANSVFEEPSSASASPSPSPIEPQSASSTSSVSFAPAPVIQHQHHAQGYGQAPGNEKTPVARSTRLPLPQTPPTGATLPVVTLPNGTPLTEAQIRRISQALDRAISSIVENEHEADDDEERILAPHSVPLGGAYAARTRPPTVRHILALH